MEENDEKRHKPKDLKAATHILKTVALRRYREKLWRQSLEDEKNSSAPDEKSSLSQSLQHTASESGDERDDVEKSVAGSSHGEQGDMRTTKSDKERSTSKLEHYSQQLSSDTDTRFTNFVATSGSLPKISTDVDKHQVDMENEEVSPVVDNKEDPPQNEDDKIGESNEIPPPANLADDDDNGTNTANAAQPTADNENAVEEAPPIAAFDSEPEVPMADQGSELENITTEDTAAVPEEVKEDINALPKESKNDSVETEEKAVKNVESVEPSAVEVQDRTDAHKAVEDGTLEETVADDVNEEKIRDEEVVTSDIKEEPNQDSEEKKASGAEETASEEKVVTSEIKEEPNQDSEEKKADGAEETASEEKVVTSEIKEEPNQDSEEKKADGAEETASEEKVVTSEIKEEPNQDSEYKTADGTEETASEKDKTGEVQQPVDDAKADEVPKENTDLQQTDAASSKPPEEEKVEEVKPDSTAVETTNEEVEFMSSVHGHDPEVIVQKKFEGIKFKKKQASELEYNEEGQLVEREAAVEPPITESSKSISSAVQEEPSGLPDDHYYNIEDYQSVSIVSNDSGIPLNMLQFFHSFGYNCHKRSNLHLLHGPTAVFAAGNLDVSILQQLDNETFFVETNKLVESTPGLIHLLNLSTGEHRFLRSCSGGGIGAITVHPTGRYFAVAEKGVKPHILIYEYPSLKLYRILRGGTEKAYTFADFNPKGNLLASVGSSPDYMLTLWDWKQEKVMLRSKAFSQEVYRVTFSPEQEGQLTSCGTSHIRFWKMAFTFTGLKLKGELGRFGKTSLTDIEGYIQLPDGKVLSGSDWGNMLLWDGGLIKVEISRKNQKPCHVGAVQQLVLDEGELITIGLDGYVRVWEMEAIDSADVTDDSDIFEIEPMNELRVGHDVQLTCMVKATPEDDPELEDGDSIWYAQDANGGIWKLDLSFSHTTKPPEKMFSFTAGAITGVSCSPSSHLLATTGDAYIRVYDYLEKTLLCHYYSPTPHTTSTSLAWPSKVVNPKGTLLVAGFSDGIMRLLTLEQIDTGGNQLILKQALKPHSSSITAIAFDNTGEYLATGSTDRTVFFFAVSKDSFDPIGFVKIPGEVTCIEWSPAGFPSTTLLASCSNGKVVEISAPTSSSADTSHSFMLHDLSVKCYTFQSIKSRLRRDELRKKREKEKAERRKKREKELKRRKDKGEEISDEDAKTFLDEDPEAEEEKEEEPLYFPPEPNSVLQAFYLTPGRFCVSMDGYDAGYLYECTFPSGDSSNDTETLTEPIRAIPVADSADVPISSFKFTEDRHKLVAGFKDGKVRVYPIEGDPEVTFDLDMLVGHWNVSMHDNDTGAVNNIAESHDGVHLFTGGCDGNIYGYVSLAHEQIAKSMEGQRAKLPTPKKATARDELVDDIDDPHAYSIEDAKLKAEHDKMLRDAEAKKVHERKKINKLRRKFLELLSKNHHLPESVRLQRQDFELDPELREKMEVQTQSRVERVRLEMQWDKAKLELARNKLEKRFRSQVEADRIVVHAFQSEHQVASFRVSKLSEEYQNILDTMEERVRAVSLASDGGTATFMDGTGTSLASDRPKDDRDIVEDDGQSFINEAKQKTASTILQGRQAEKVAKALRKAADARDRRLKRQQEWDELNKSKPDEFYEDPADVAAIREAQANMGDFKLKTAPDYVVPEHLRMDTEKKRFQILLLQELIHRAKTDFNKKLIALRDTKFENISQMKEHVKELKKLQMTMQKEDRFPLPTIPQPHWEEEPNRKYEYTKETLLKFEEEEKQRKIDEAMKKRQGDGGLFGGFGDQKGEDDAMKPDKHKAASSVASSALSRPGQHGPPGDDDASHPTVLELQLAKIESIRVKYQRDRLLRLIDQTITSFDAELRLFRHTKQNLDVDLKMADLRQVTLIEELLLLKEYEKREKTLSGRVLSKKNELAEINGKAADMQVRLEAKRRDIERLNDREKALYASFAASLGDGNKFTDFLNKVFKKRIKRARKKIAVEGQEEDSDESSSDESDWSSDEDEDDSVEGGFDDSICPPGCDQQLFDSTISLREKRLDLEEALVDEKKLADTLKKDADSCAKKAKVMESQLKTALADLEAFQVEKQGKLNELDVVVPLRLHQVEHVYNASVPSDLSPCLVFTNSSLTTLQRRIKELQHEKSDQRKRYKEARQQHVHLIKNRRVMEERINVLEEKCENMMMLKFGRVVDLEKLDSVTINKNVEELKEQVRRNEEKNASELSRRQKHIERLKDRISELTKDNTARLERLNVLISDKDELEQSLDYRQRTMELEDNNKKKSELREQHRLVQLVQLQAQEVQALKEEIGLLSRKGGHILPPAQPPLGQEGEGM